MGFQNSTGFSAGKEQEVGKVKGDQERAEEEEDEDGRRDLGTGVLTNFTGLYGRKDILSCIPHTSRDLWNWGVCVIKYELKMKGISSGGAFHSFSVFPQKLWMFRYMQENQECPHCLSQVLDRDLVPALVPQCCQKKPALLVSHMNPFSPLTINGNCSKSNYLRDKCTQQRGAASRVSKGPILSPLHLI